LGTITGGNQNLTIAGNAVLSGGSGIGALQVTGAGNTTTINGAITTTTSVNIAGTSTIGANVTTTGAQTYTGAVTLTGTGGIRTLAGSTVTMGAIDGGGNSLTITGAAVFDGANNTGIATLTVSGASTIRGNITSTGNQTYTGAVTLGANVNFTGGSSSNVLFSSTVNGNNAARALTVTTANVRFDGVVGGTTPPASVTVTAGTSTINANINTSGNQSYAAVILFGNPADPWTLTSTSGSVAASGAVSGGRGIEVHASRGITLNNAANTLSWDIRLFNNQTGATQSGAVSFTTNSTTGLSVRGVNPAAGASPNGNFTINTGGNITVSSANISAAGTVTLTVGGAILQNGTITAANLAATASNIGVTAPDIGIALAQPNNISSGAVLNNASTGNINFTNTSTAGTFTLTADNTAASGTISVSRTGAMSVTSASTPAGGSISLRTTGAGNNLTQTGMITTGALTVNSGGAITLNSANSVASLNATASGAVQFTNSAALTVAGVSVTGNNNVAITTSAGNITQTGAISTGGTAALTSAAGSITINATIGSSTLALNAPAGTVTIGNAVTVTGGDNTAHNANAGVFITADSITGSGGITLNASPTVGWVCAYIDNAISYTGAVTGSRIHYHITPGKHIVYRNGTDAGSYDGIAAGSYLYLQSNLNLGTPINFATTGAGNIYIIAVGNNTNANTRAVNFSTEAGGHIEIRGAYTSSGALTLNAGTAGVRLENAAVNLTGAGNNFNIGSQPLTLAGTGSTITAATVTMGAITGAGDFTITGNAVFNGTPSSAAGIAVLSVSGTSTINGNITTTGNQTYTGAVTLSGTAVPPRTLTGTTVTMGAITGGGHSLTVTGDAVFTGTPNSATGIVTLNVTGTSSIAGNITTTTGGQTYTGAVTLTGTANFTGNAGTTVQFSSTVNGTHGLTVTTADVQFSGAVGGTAALTSVTITAATSTSTISGNAVTTTGAQTYNGPVILGAAINFTSTSTPLSLVRFGNTVNGTYGLTVTTANAQFEGAVGGTAALTSVNVTAANSTSTINANITTTTGGQTYAGAVTLTGTANFTGNAGTTVQFSSTVNGAHGLTVTTADVQFRGAVGGTAALTSVTVTAATSTSTISGNAVTTTGAQTYNGPVILGAGVNFSAASGSLVTFGNTVNGAYELTVTAANVQFSNTVGGTTNLASVNVTAGSSTINASVTTTGIQTYTGTVTLSGTAVPPRTLQGTTVTMGAITGSSNSLTISGNAVLNGGSGINELSITGTNITINGNITTGGAQTYTGAVTLGGAGARMLNSGGVVTTTQNVSAPNGVTIEADGIIIGGGINSVPVTTTGVINLDSAGSITLNGPVYGLQLTAIAIGTVTFGARVEVSSTVDNAAAHSAPNNTNNLENAPIYVKAFVFVPNGGNNSIFPGGVNGRLCLELDNSTTYTNPNPNGSGGGDFDAYVDGYRYHIHGAASSATNRDLVYYDSAMLLSAIQAEFSPPSNYNYVSSSSSELEFHVDPSRNIHIYRIGNTAHSIIFTVSTGASHTGSIKIYGSYSAPGLTLHPGDGGVELLENADIILSTGFSTDGKKLTLLGTASNSITASSITLGIIEGTEKHLTLNAAGAVSLNGTAGTNAARLGTVTVANGNVTSGANDIYAANYTQNAGTVSMGGRTINTTADISLSSTAVGSGILTLTAGGAISLTSITGTGNLSMTAVGNVSIAGAGTAGTRFGNITVTAANNVSFSQNVFATSVSITNNTVPSTISANINTSGTQTYAGTVTLGANVNFTADSGNTVTFGNTVNGAFGLTATTADVHFIGAVGGVTPLASVNVTAGSSTVDANITTAGNQSYAAVNLGSTLQTLTSTGGSVTAAGAVSGSAGITVNALQGITMNAANTLSGDVTLENTQTGTRTGNISFINTSASLNLTANNSTASGEITVRQTGAMSITSASTPTNGRISLTATGTVTQTGAVTTGALAVSSGGAITLNAANNAASLNVTASGGAVQFTNNAALSVAGVSGVGNNNVTITTNTGAVRNITQTGAITTTGTLTLSSSGAITLNGANAAGTLTVTAASGAVQFTNNAALAVGGVSGVGSNNVTITTTGAASGITQTGTITTTGTLTVHSGGAVTLNGANAVTSLNVTAAGGAVQFTNAAALTVAGVSGVSNNNVTITTTGAASGITQTGTITTTGTLTVHSGGAVTLNGANAAGTLTVTAASGAVQFTNNAALAVGGVSGVGNNNVTITTTGPAGGITQSGIITTGGTLAVTSSGNIALGQNNQAPTVNLSGAGAVTYHSGRGAGNDLTVTAVTSATSGGTIDITEATGNIVIANTSTPAVRTGTPQGAVNITATAGSVTVTGNIGNGNGAVTLSSANNQDITINGTINCYRLALTRTVPTTAGTGTVRIGGAITVSSSNATSHDANDAVYIRAGNIAGNGGINLTSTGWVCAYIDSTIGYTGTVTDGRIHYHIAENSHIVYSRGAPGSFSTTPPITGSYVYLQADDSLGPSINWATTGTGNIYIIGITSGSGQANTRTVNFSTATGGHIEIRGDYISTSGALNLSPGTGGIQLRNANINLSGTFDTHGALLTSLTATNSITAANITLADVVSSPAGNGLTLTADSNVSITGTVGTTGDHLGALTVTGAAIAISQNVNTTGNQIYNGSVTLGGTGRAFTSSGGSVTVNGHVSGNGIAVNALHGISIGNSADRNAVSGSVTLNNTQTGTATGNISFFNNSTSITLTANNNAASGTITVDETGSLIIDSGGVTSSAGAVNLVGTTGIIVNGPVYTGPTGAAINLSSTGGAVSGTGQLTGTNLIANAGSGISLTAANNVGNVSLTNGTTGNIAYDSGVAGLTVTTAINNAANAPSGGNITITERTGNLIIANAVNPAVRTGAQHGAVRLTAPAGSVTVDGNIGSSGNGAVTLTSGNNQNIRIDGTINCYSLALISGVDGTETTGTVTLAGSIIAASTGETHIQTSAVYVWAGTLTGSGSVSLPAAGGWVCVWFFEEYDFGGNVTGSSNPDIIHTHAGGGRSIVYSIGTRANFISNANPSITEPFAYYDAGHPLGASISATAIASGNIYIVGITSGNGEANTRSIAFTTQSGFIEIRGDYISSGTLALHSGSGDIRLRDANINLSGAPFNTNGASLRLLDAANSITASAMTLDSVEGSGHNLTLSSAGNILVNGAVGSSANRLGDITVTNGGIIFESQVSAANFTQAAGTAEINAAQNYSGAFTFSSTGNLAVNNASITTTGAIAVTGNAALSGNVALNSGSGGTITLAAVTGTGNLTVNNGGQYTQGGALTANSFRQTGSGAVSLNADITVTAANMAAAVISFSSQAVFANALTLTVPPTGGVVDFAQDVDGDVALTLSGGSFDSDSAYLELNRNTGFKGGVIVSAASHVKVNSGRTITQVDGETLTLQSGSALDTSAGSWHMGSSSSANDFAGVNGTLTLGEGSRLTANALNLTGSPFTINNTGWAYVIAKANAAIESAVMFTGDHPQLVLEMAGSGAQSLTADQPIGSLSVKPGSRTNLAKDLNIRGSVLIQYALSAPSSPSQQPPGPYGVLNAGGFKIEMYGELERNGSNYGRWEILNSHENITLQSAVHDQMNAFVQDYGGTVEFKRNPAALTSDPLLFEIIGNTVWQKFVCSEGGTKFQFSMHPDQHAFLNTFDVSGMSGSHITLTRYVDPDDSAKSQWKDYYDGSLLPPSDTNPQDVDGLPRVPASRNLKTGDESELKKFWNFNLVPSSGEHRLMDISNLTIFFSHAWHQRVPIASETMNLNAVPFYRVKADGTREGYFNYDWIEVRKIIYSFVEDGNGNGKLDRIRVQTNVPLNGDFSRFNVEVEGYNVDTGRGTHGFEKVEDVKEVKDGLDLSSFYIYIEEGPFLYDGNSVKWWVTENESLMDYATQTLPVGEPVTGDPETDELFHTINTIPPRVSFALTLPGHNQTYVHVSQPVFDDGGAAVTGKGVTGSTSLDITPSRILELNYYPFDASPVPYPVTVPEGVLNYLLELDYSPTVSDLANFPPIGKDPGEYYFALEGFKDLSVRALDWNDPLVDETAYMYYPSPRYPIDWNYSGYDEYTGNSHIPGLSADVDRGSRPEVFLPPNRMLTPEMINRLQEYAAGQSASKLKPEDFKDSGLSYKRRITDVLVSMTPTNTDSENYFAWPVWARYKDTSRHQSLNPDSSFWGQQNTDDGIIWAFDGTKYLEERDITLQARINNRELEGFSGMSLFYGVDVPVEWRDPAEAGARGKGPGGLWLPGLSLNVNPHYNIVPSRTRDMRTGLLTFYPANQKSPAVSTNPLFNFDIEKADGNFSSGVKLDFLLRLDKPGVDPNLFVARFEVPSGADLRNLEWWTMVRPFSFDLQNIRLQRGGVTILNNVINSNNREITYIRYHLVRPGRVTIQVYTLDGTLVKSIRRNEQRDAGEWTDVWDGTNNGRRAVARGMYFVRVVGPDIDEIRKVMVIK
jgi:hypothetical protein